MNYDNHACLVCGYMCCNRRSLGNHLARSHKDEFPEGVKTYTLVHDFESRPPRCKCGCGNEVLWHKSLYRFNDYVNGHNPGGFSSENQPGFTNEMIEYRNEKIRNAYSSNGNGESIRDKISKSVSEALKNSDINFSEYFKEKWRDEKFRQMQQTGRFKSWSGLAGDERRKKVFTPEFGHKISLANMRRDLQHTSKEEQGFVLYLKNVFDEKNIFEQKWINSHKRTMCSDAYIANKNTYVEFDGVYWHGLDRDSDWSFQQIGHIANDLRKNKIAIDERLNYIRLRSDVNYLSIRSYDDLVAAAYHVVIDGRVIKEGSFKFSSDTHAILSRDALIRINELTPNLGRKHTETEVLPLMEKFWKAYVDYWGWFYPLRDESSASSVVKKLSAKKTIVVDDKISMAGSTGSTWLKTRFKSYWNVENGPVKSFYKDNVLRSVLKYRLGLNNSMMYDYVLSDGTPISCKETFDINIKNVRFGFVVQRSAVSFFKPTTAKDVYTHLLRDVSDPRVWDPSSGFGARLLGFVASHGRSGEYWGCEPANETYADLCGLRDELIQEGCATKDSIRLYNVGSEKIDLPRSYFDVVFTSPPYFDKEKYFNEDGQCWKDYPTLDSWITNYLRPTLEKAYESLKIGGVLAINFDDACSTVLKDVAKVVGFVYEKTIDLTLNSDHFVKKMTGASKQRRESLDVYRKT